MSEHLKIEPMDEHNRELLAGAHPDDWVNPETSGRYNMVVIGAGTAGLVTALGAAGVGAKVALVERYLMGGDCLNFGCVPSKAIIRSSRDAHAKGSSGTDVDFPAVMERMRRLRARISHHDSAERIAGLGVDLFLGQGRFTGPDTLEVDGKVLRFARACIATGARAAEPAIEGLAEAGYLTNETVFSLTERPRRLAVIGGGPIGCELGQAMGRLGCEVTIFQHSSRIMSREDADVSSILSESLRRDGICILTDANVNRVSADADAKTIHFTRDGLDETLDVDAILVAVGRAPNVEGLGLDVAGVDYDSRKGVIVNDKLRTSNRRIYAAGDICMSHKFTHAADFAARIVIQNALFWGRKKLSALTIPWCTYTAPEVAHVGFSAATAAKAGIEIDTFTKPFGEVDR